MAYICRTPGKCKNCSHYRYDDDYGAKCCWAQWDEKHNKQSALKNGVTETTTGLDK